MEFDMDSAEAVELLNKYAEEGKGVSYARRAIVFADRNRPGKIIQIVFFNSVEEAELNNNLDITQNAAAEFSAKVGDVQFTDLDVLAEVSL
ncbi:MAG: hypothetical protein ACJAQ9_000075 [Ilumatobacter sp.]|jgi:hypothetical protein